MGPAKLWLAGQSPALLPIHGAMTPGYPVSLARLHRTSKVQNFTQKSYKLLESKVTQDQQSASKSTTIS
jgi:hypothetical protein